MLSVVYNIGICTVTCHFFVVGETDLPPKLYGSQFSIKCDSGGEDIDHWTLNDNRITGATDGIDSSSIASPTLHVEFMMLSLEGQYQCFGVSSGPLNILNVFIIGKIYCMLVSL